MESKNLENNSIFESEKAEASVLSNDKVQKNDTLLKKRKIGFSIDGK